MRIRTVDKVTGFITRWRNGEQEILVLGHPSAGRQLPAGTVEINEQPDRAILREIAEETGLADVKIEAYLGFIETNMVDDNRVILLTTKLFSTPSFDSSSEGYILERGSPVQLTREVGKFSEILGDPLDPHAEPVLRKEKISGYVRSSLLGKQIRRHLYYLRTIAISPESWERQADGHLFELRWLKLYPRPVLHPEHSQLLDLFYDRLITEVSPGDTTKG